MAWCVRIGYGNASLVAGSRAPQPTGEEGLYTANWRGMRGSQKEKFWFAPGEAWGFSKRKWGLKGKGKSPPSKQKWELKVGVYTAKNRPKIG